MGFHERFGVGLYLHVYRRFVWSFSIDTTCCVLYPVSMSYHLESIPNRNSRPTLLIREAWREGKRIRKKTRANLTGMPEPLVNGIRALLKGGIALESVEDAFTIRRALPHGHVAAGLATLRRLGLVRLLHRHPGRQRDLAIAGILARLLDPGSKLAAARHLSPDTAASSLGAVLGLGPVTGNELLDMLDWLLRRQRHIEKSLAHRHLGEATLILYDVTSSFLEGGCCPLAAFGHNRDGKKGKKQIVFGLLCTEEGCPVAVEVFAGNRGDPMTLGAQIAKIRDRFGVGRVALVGDRGMITTARIREELEPATLDWISALKATDIRKLLRQQGADGGEPAPLCPEALVPDQVAEIVSPEFPGERLLVCLNPRLREQRARKREALLEATEEILETISQGLGRPGAPHRGRDWINRRVGREANRRKVEKHFQITVTDEALTWSRNQEKIAAEARLDGLYVIRTSLDAATMGPGKVVEAYKSLSRVEQAFRSLKTTRLQVRPVYVYNADRVRAHLFLCMLAYYVEWHLRRRLAPLLFEDDDRQQARAKRTSPVQPAQISDRAKAKADTKTTAEGFPVHSLKTLLADLATLTLNQVTLPTNPEQGFPMIAQPTPLQRKAFELLEVEPAKIVPSTMPV